MAGNCARPCTWRDMPLGSASSRGFPSWRMARSSPRPMVRPEHFLARALRDARCRRHVRHRRLCVAAAGSRLRGVELGAANIGRIPASRWSGLAEALMAAKSPPPWSHLIAIERPSPSHTLESLAAQSRGGPRLARIPGSCPPPIETFATTCAGSRSTRTRPRRIACSSGSPRSNCPRSRRSASATAATKSAWDSFRLGNDRRSGRRRRAGRRSDRLPHCHRLYARRRREQLGGLRPGPGGGATAGRCRGSGPRLGRRAASAV